MRPAPLLQVWAQCMLALQPAGASVEEGLRGVREQARRLIDASMGRHVKRVRLAMRREAPPDAVLASASAADAGGATAEAAEEVPSIRG